MTNLPALDYFNNELKEQMNNFTASFNQKIQQGKNELIINKDKYVEIINDLTLQQNDLINQTEALNRKYASLEKRGIEEVKDLELAQLKNDELVLQKQQYEDMKKELSAKVDGLNQQISEKRRDLNSLTDKLVENKRLNLLELNKFESYLGLQIEGLRPDLLKFNFKNIDVNDYNKIVWFKLDLSSELYKITESNPKLSGDQVLQLESHFNDHKDLARFLKEIRSALSHS